MEERDKEPRIAQKNRCIRGMFLEVDTHHLIRVNKEWKSRRQENGILKTSEESKYALRSST